MAMSANDDLTGVFKGGTYAKQDGFALYQNVVPRLGASWDVKGDGSLAFRSSYSLSTDFPSGDYMNINASAPPWGNRSLVTTTSFDDPYAVVGGSPHPVATAKSAMNVFSVSPER
mgnify:CR=1 FL=1